MNQLTISHPVAAIRYPCILCKTKPQTRHCRGLCRECKETWGKLGYPTKRCGGCHTWKPKTSFAGVGQKRAPFCLECDGNTRHKPKGVDQ